MHFLYLPDSALIVGNILKKLQLCFIVERISVVTREFIYNVSPSTIFLVKQLNKQLFLLI